MSPKPNETDATYNRILEAVQETHPTPGPIEALYFEPETGKLLVQNPSRRSTVAAGTLAREGFFQSS